MLDVQCEVELINQDNFYEGSFYLSLQRVPIIMKLTAFGMRHYFWTAIFTIINHHCLNETGNFLEESENFNVMHVNPLIFQAYYIVRLIKDVCNKNLDLLAGYSHLKAIKCDSEKVVLHYFI